METVSSPGAVYRAVEARAFDAALLDLNYARDTTSGTEGLELLERLRAETGLPVSTMTEAVVDGLRSVGAKRVAVATAYSDLVNDRLADFLKRSGCEVLSMKGFGLVGFGDAANQSEQDIIDLSGKAFAAGHSRSTGG